MAQHPIVHFEIHGADRKALGAFYADAFGWTFTDMPEMEYGMIEIGEEGLRGGGLMTSNEGARGTVIYMSCPDIHATVAKAVGNGAEIINPVETVPGVVTYAVLRDPQGNRFGLTADEIPT